MKKLLLLLSLTLIAATSFGQNSWGVDFESPQFLNRVVIDTANPNNSWQIGHPGKTIFTSALSVPNALVTDTLNPVPPNDTSIFYLKHLRDQFQPYHTFDLGFWYQMNGDTTDFGKIEISPDTGITWVNVLTEDITYNMNWLGPKPSLAGSANGWQYFHLDMTYWATGLGVYPVYMTADTILFRFTYITSSSASQRDGWMIDNIFIEDYMEGVHEIQNDNLISISPNPAADELKIHRTKTIGKQQIQILNYTGQVLIDQKNYNGEPINTKQLSNGLYLLNYTDGKNFSIKKFVVEH